MTTEQIIEGIRQLNQEKDDNFRKMCVLADEIENLNKEADDLYEDNRSLCQQRDSLLAEIERLNQEVTRYENEKRLTIRKMDILASAYEKLRSEQQSAAADVAPLYAEIDRLREENVQLSAKNEEYRAYAADLRKRLVAYETAERVQAEASSENNA